MRDGLSSELLQEQLCGPLVLCAQRDFHMIIWSKYPSFRYVV
jgi:hypothetical protein